MKDKKKELELKMVAEKEEYVREKKNTGAGERKSELVRTREKASKKGIYMRII